MSFKRYVLTLLFLCLLIPTINFNSFAQTSCISNDPNDWDGDMIPNEWETKGIDINEDKIIDYGLSSFESSPLHKDLFLEIDHMKNHDIFNGVLDDVIDSFANAPVCNPDGKDGIKLHIQYDPEEIIPHQNVIHLDSFVGSEFKRTWHGFNELKDEYFGIEEEKKDNLNVNNTLLAKSKVFHYAILAHAFSYPDNSHSGISRGQPGMDFIVTLGNWQSGGANIQGDFNGNRYHQAGTLMHELGHNLGLGHGGGDSVNCKPNYLSIMNYIRQMPVHLPPAFYKLDYSGIELNPLNETNLNEEKGISTKLPVPVDQILVWGPIGAQFGFVDKPIDWNYDAKYNVNAKADVNLFPLIPACSKSSLGETLKSYNDWDNLIYLTQSNKTAHNEQESSGLANIEYDELRYEDIQNSLAGKLAEYHDKTQILLSEDSILQSKNISDTDEPFEMMPESIPPDEVQQDVEEQSEQLAEEAGFLMAEEGLDELAIGLPPLVSSLMNIESEDSADGVSDTDSDTISSKSFYTDNILESVEAPKSIQSSQSTSSIPLPPPPAQETYSNVENVNEELNLVTPESISLVTKVNSGQYDLNQTQVLNNLESIKTVFDSELGGLEDDDRISDTSDQLNLYAYTDQVIDIFKANSCLENNCIPLGTNNMTNLY